MSMPTIDPAQEPGYRSKVVRASGTLADRSNLSTWVSESQGSPVDGMPAPAPYPLRDLRAS